MSWRTPEPTMTVDRYGGTYSVTMEPRIRWWVRVFRPREAERIRNRWELEKIAREMDFYTPLIDESLVWARRYERELRRDAYRTDLILGAEYVDGEWRGGARKLGVSLTQVASGARFLQANFAAMSRSWEAYRGEYDRYLDGPGK